MPSHRLIITEVTSYGDLYCVAGWDVDRGAMIRPEPYSANAAVQASRFWREPFAGPGKLFEVGNFVRLADITDAPFDFEFPHRTEDRIVTRGSEAEILSQHSPAQIAQAVAGGVSNSLRAVFGPNLQRTWTGPGSTKAYVPRGNVGRSLGAIETTPTRVRLTENTYNPAKPQLRALIKDGLTTYDLSVTSASIRTLWKAQGVDAVRAELANCQRVHIRVGLSRPFPDKPNECYAQVNGLYFVD